MHPKSKTYKHFMDSNVFFSQLLQLVRLLALDIFIDFQVFRLLPSTQKENKKHGLDHCMILHDWCFDVFRLQNEL